MACVCAHVHVWESNFARLLGYCLRQFVCPAAGHGAKGESALLEALEGSAGSRPQPGACSADSCFIWHLCVWWFFPRDVKAALWGGKVHSAAGVGGKSPSLPCLARRAFAPAAGQSQHWGEHRSRVRCPHMALDLQRGRIATGWLLLTHLSAVVQTVGPLHGAPRSAVAEILLGLTWQHRAKCFLLVDHLVGRDL